MQPEEGERHPAGDHRLEMRQVDGEIRGEGECQSADQSGGG
jgi:hypothetical protein